jgi:aryl-alcohol dehydrogenase-like predicted oxidoreductase
MKTRRVAGVDVAEIGFGCMTLSHAYGVPPPPEQAAALLRAAVEAGVTHFDTAALYGFGRNEELVGPVLKPYRQQIHLASKCGLIGVDGKRVLDGRPQTLKRTCEDSLRRLQTEVIDLYYLHRIDKAVPVEESVGALSELVAEGKIRTIGLSEVSAASLRRAHAVHPIAAVQSEYSLWTRNPEIAVADACRELGATLVAFSPVGRGFLAGAFRDPSELPEGDIRRGFPRYNEPHLSANLALLEEFQAIAREVGTTPARLAIAWTLAQGPHVFPIPGTTRIEHLHDDLGASDVVLSRAVVDRVSALGLKVSGNRYPPASQREVDSEQFAYEAA